MNVASLRWSNDQGRQAAPSKHKQTSWTDLDLSFETISVNFTMATTMSPFFRRNSSAVRRGLHSQLGCRPRVQQCEPTSGILDASMRKAEPQLRSQLFDNFPTCSFGSCFCPPLGIAFGCLRLAVFAVARFAVCAHHVFWHSPTRSPPLEKGSRPRRFDRHNVGAESIRAVLTVWASDNRTSYGDILRPRLRGIFRSYA